MQMDRIRECEGRRCRGRAVWNVVKTDEVWTFDHTREGVVRLREQPDDGMHPVIVMIGDYAAYPEDLVMLEAI
jgi:hypothetical protein